MVFVYHFEDHPVYGPLTSVLFDAVNRGELRAHLSVLLAGEVLTGPKRDDNARILRLYRHVLNTFPNVTLHPVTLEVMEWASDLRARYGLRTPDAVHVATAQLNGAKAFVTNDKRLRRVAAEGIDVIILDDFVAAG
jgi:predicted nucleic acid-binding protein